MARKGEFLPVLILAGAGYWLIKSGWLAKLLPASSNGLPVSKSSSPTPVSGDCETEYPEAMVAAGKCSGKLGTQAGKDCMNAVFARWPGFKSCLLGSTPVVQPTTPALPPGSPAPKPKAPAAPKPIAALSTAGKLAILTAADLNGDGVIGDADMVEADKLFTEGRLMPGASVQVSEQAKELITNFWVTGARWGAKPKPAVPAPKPKAPAAPKPIAALSTAGKLAILTAADLNGDGVIGDADMVEADKLFTEGRLMPGASVQVSEQAKELITNFWVTGARWGAKPKPVAPAKPKPPVKPPAAPKPVWQRPTWQPTWGRGAILAAADLNGDGVIGDAEMVEADKLWREGRLLPGASVQVKDQAMNIITKAWATGGRY